MGPRRQGLVEPGSTKGLITFTSSDAEERRCRLRKGGLPSALFPYDQEEKPREQGEELEAANRDFESLVFEGKAVQVGYRAELKPLPACLHTLFRRMLVWLVASGRPLARWILFFVNSFSLIDGRINAFFASLVV